MVSREDLAHPGAHPCSFEVHVAAKVLKCPFLKKLTLARSNSISLDIAMHDYNLLSLLISGPFFCGTLLMTPGKVLVMETYTAFDAFSVIKTHLTYLYTFHSFGEQF